ncbi:MAG: HAD family hydrolase [Oscillospiraceae bacterium]|nr:HAD family hydrolase [Oscillospiraceae bacterium]
MKIKAAIFDMDGTLVNSLILWDVMWSFFGERFLNDKNFRPAAEDDKKVRTMILSDAMDLIHERYGLASGGAELLRLANDTIADFYRNRVEMKPGAKEFLDHCLAQGVRMCIASATAPDMIALAMEHCGLEKYFLKVFSCGDIGKGKEEPDIFLMARDFLGTKTEETWVFEDSLAAIRTASAIGMPTVGIFDACNFGQDEIRALASVYVGEDETLMKLVP